MYLEMMECHIPFWVTVSLTSDLVLRINVFAAYLLYSFRQEFQIGVYMHLGMGKCHLPFSGHCDLDLVLMKIVSGAYLLYYLR